jgi:hypothetical protein
MTDYEKLYIIINTQLESLQDKLKESKASWEIEKYESQIDILNKVLKQAGLKGINDK